MADEKEVKAEQTQQAQGAQGVQTSQKAQTMPESKKIEEAPPWNKKRNIKPSFYAGLVSLILVFLFILFVIYFLGKT